MSASGWLLCSITCFALAGACVGFAVLLFFRYKIPGVVSDLSGKRAAKEVAALRGDSSGKQSGDHAGRASDFEAMAIAHENKRLDKTSGNLDGQVEVLDDDGGSPTEDFRESGRAELLSEPSGAAVTGVLNERRPLEIGITQVLNETEGAYEIQAPDESRRTTEDLKRIDHFEITRSVTVIHTDEVI